MDLEHEGDHMTKTDKRVDAYIAKAPDYAKPILTRIRSMVHEAAPDAEETLKWGHPTFVQNGILCGMAAFKEYCAVNFWKAVLIMGEHARQTDSAGVLGKITSVKDLPPKSEFIKYVKRAVELNQSGEKVPRLPAKPKKALAMPDDFQRAIKGNPKAFETFQNFSPSHQREYIEWITEAKRAETRAERLKTTLQWVAEGKPRNWKYMR